MGGVLVSEPVVDWMTWRWEGELGGIRKEISEERDRGGRYKTGRGMGQTIYTRLWGCGDCLLEDENGRMRTGG